MIRILGTIFAGLLGLAFGSFLNVCLSRWPHGESIVTPGSHCRNCDHTLAWWENLPLVSWVLLRGRCRACGEAIPWRYPAVEFAVAALWAYFAWHSIPAAADLGVPAGVALFALATCASEMLLSWLLVALAVLDAENLWLPDKVTLPGIALGLGWSVMQAQLAREQVGVSMEPETTWVRALGNATLAAAIAAALILAIWGIYRLIRNREGIGLGDAKLMALIGAWLGLREALLTFVLGAVIGAAFALVLLTVPNRNEQVWRLRKLPLGTFLCVGGIVSSLWGQQMIAAYLRWFGLQ